MPKTLIRQFKAKKVRVLTKKRTQCLRKHCKEWISNILLYKKLKIGLSYLAKALSKQKKKSIELMAEIQKFHKTQITATSNVLNKAMEIQKLWVTTMNHVTNTISMRQEPHNPTVSSVSAGRKESSNRSTTDLSTSVVKPTVSGRTITKPTINLSLVNTENINNTSRLVIEQDSDMSSSLDLQKKRVNTSSESQMSINSSDEDETHVDPSKRDPINDKVSANCNLQNNTSTSEEDPLEEPHDTVPSPNNQENGRTCRLPKRRLTISSPRHNDAYTVADEQRLKRRRRRSGLPVPVSRNRRSKIDKTPRITRHINVIEQDRNVSPDLRRDRSELQVSINVSSSSSEEDETHVSKSKGTSWDKEEKIMLLQLFGEFIRKNKVPSILQIMYIMRQNPNKLDRTTYGISYQLRQLTKFASKCKIKQS